MKKYLLILIILVSAFGCGKVALEEKINDLESENTDLDIKLQKQSVVLESSTDVIKDVTALIKVIHETESKIEDNKHKLRIAKEVEGTIDKRDEISKSIQGLYDDLKKYREKAAELQRKLDSLAAIDAQQKETISSLSSALEVETMKVEGMSKKIGTLNRRVVHLVNKQRELTTNISYLKNELDLKTEEISRKDLEIKNLHQEINSIFYLVGSSSELRRKKIIVKKGIPLFRAFNPFSKNYVLGENFTLADFSHEKTIFTDFSVDGRIKKILPYRNKHHYDITYDYEKGLSLVNITDSKNFWHQKYLVIVTW
jgi:uncharacterized coiled-coil DUF342 family protein